MGIYQGNYSIIPEVKSAYKQAVAGGYIGTEEEFNGLFAEALNSVESQNDHIDNVNNPHNVTADQLGAISIIDARSADYNMDDIIKSDEHCAIYKTNYDTKGTPYCVTDEQGRKGVLTNNKSGAMILSFANSTEFGVQFALYQGANPFYRTLIQGNEEPGDWIKICSEEDLDNYNSSIEKIRRANNRKMLSMISTLIDHKKHLEKIDKKSNCRVTEVGQDYVILTVSSGDTQRKVRINTGELPNNGYIYEFRRLDECSFDRTTVYSTTSKEKTFIQVDIDGVRYENYSALRTSDFTFNNLVATYKVTEDGQEILVSMFVSPEKISVCETYPSTPNNPGLISGYDVVNVATHGDSLKIFSMTNTGHYFTEKVQVIGNSVIKTFDLQGGFGA